MFLPSHWRAVPGHCVGSLGFWYLACTLTFYRTNIDLAESLRFTSFLSLELLLGALPVVASSDGSLATCKSLLLVNSAWQLQWYFMGFAGSSLLVEASKTGL